MRERAHERTHRPLRSHVQLPWAGALHADHGSPGAHGRRERARRAPRLTCNPRRTERARKGPFLLPDDCALPVDVELQAVALEADLANVRNPWGKAGVKPGLGGYLP